MHGAPSSSATTSPAAGTTVEHTVQRRAPGLAPVVRRSRTRVAGMLQIRDLSWAWTARSTPAEVNASSSARTYRGASTVGTPSAREVHWEYQPFGPLTVSDRKSTRLN